MATCITSTFWKMMRMPLPQQNDSSLKTNFIIMHSCVLNFCEILVICQPFGKQDNSIYTNWLISHNFLSAVSTNMKSLIKVNLVLLYSSQVSLFNAFVLKIRLKIQPSFRFFQALSVLERMKIKPVVLENFCILFLWISLIIMQNKKVVIW